MAARTLTLAVTIWGPSANAPGPANAPTAREGLPGTRQAGTTRICSGLVASWRKAFILGEIQAEARPTAPYKRLTIGTDLLLLG